MRRLRITSVLLLAAGLMALTGSLPAQTSGPKPEGQPSEASAQSSKEGEHGAAAEEREENAEFKESPAVRMVAKWIGVSPTAAYWILYSLDFGIIAVLIVWGARSKLPGAFRGRTQAIQKSMQEAQKASAEANARLAAIEDRLERLDAEIAHMRAAAEQDAGAEEERIRAAAEEEKRKIIGAAGEEIAAAASLARRELKSYTGELAVTLAARKIRLGAGEDKALVRSFVDQLKDGE